MNDLIARLKQAQAALSEAITRQWAGGHALRVSIPAQPDHDTDVVIGDALHRAIACIEAIERVLHQRNVGTPSPAVAMAEVCRTCGGSCTAGRGVP